MFICTTFINHYTTPADDFVVSDESSVEEEEDEFISTYLLCGPPGVGKTASVYALAKELGYKVSHNSCSGGTPFRTLLCQ